MIVRVVNTALHWHEYKQNLTLSSPPRYSSLTERGNMSGEPQLHRMPPPSPSLRRNSLHSPENSYSSLRRSSTADSPYYSSPSPLSNSLRRSVTNQSAGSHSNTTTDPIGSTSETPVSYTRYSSLLDDKHDRGWGTLPRRHSRQFQHDDIKF